MASPRGCSDDCWSLAGADGLWFCPKCEQEVPASNHQHQCSTTVWDAYIQRIASLAVAEGMRKQGRDAWWCPHCAKDVAEGNLENHLHSKNHKRYKSWVDNVLETHQRKDSGELPEWMTIVNGDVFCTLCERRATEGHLHCTKHQKALAWFEQERLNVPTPIPFWQPAHVPPRMPRVPGLGGRGCNFEWQADSQRIFCKPWHTVAGNMRMLGPS